jgi:hypothetical protein
MIESPFKPEQRGGTEGNGGKTVWLGVLMGLGNSYPIGEKNASGTSFCVNRHPLAVNIANRFNRRDTQFRQPWIGREN